MDKDIIINNKYGEIKIIDRKKITLSGVNKLVSFNPNEFLIETSLGILLLKGNELEIVKLDIVEGNLSIKGKIDSLDYIESNKKSDQSFFARLFK